MIFKKSQRWNKFFSTNHMIRSYSGALKWWKFSNLRMSTLAKYLMDTDKKGVNTSFNWYLKQLHQVEIKSIDMHEIKDFLNFLILSNYKVLSKM